MAIPASPLIRTIGRNMEVLALKRGWTLTELAQRGEIPVNHLRSLKNGQLRYLDPEVIESLLETLAIEPNALLLPMADVIYD